MHEESSPVALQYNLTITDQIFGLPAPLLIRLDPGLDPCLTIDGQSS